MIPPARKFLYWMIPAGILVCILAYGLYQGHEMYLSRTLTAANVETSVLVGGNTYRISNGSAYSADGLPAASNINRAALTLAYAQTIAQRSPFFALAGTDPKRLMLAIGELKKTRTLLLNFQDTQDQKDLLTSLYPLDMLAAAANAESKRQRFLQEGSDSAYREYQSAVDTAFRSYAHDIRSFSEAFEKAVPPTTKTYATARYLIKRSDILTMLRSLETSTEQTRAAYRHLTWCLAGATPLCDSSALEYKLPPRPATTTASLPNRAAVNRARTLLRTAGLPVHDNSGTAIALSNSRCVRKRQTMPAFDIFHETTGTLPHARAFQVDDIRFVSPQRNTAIPNFNFYDAANVHFLLISPFNYYKCPYFGTDWNALFTASDAAALTRSLPASTWSNDSVTRARLAPLEKSLQSPQIIADTAGAEYVYALGEALRTGSVIPRFRNQLSDIVLATINTSSHLEDIVFEIARTEQVGVEIHDEEGVPVDKSTAQLYLVRSAFTTLFLASNTSITDGRDDFFSEHSIPASREPYIYLSDIPQYSAAERAIAHDLTYFNSLHRPLP